MSNEVIELKSSLPERAGGLALITKHDVDAMKKQRELLKEFVSSQLVEADFSNKNSPSYGEGDFGIIPGTKKRCLFKQGAEKLQKLFQLGCRFKLVDKEIDKAANFAMFTYKAEVYVLSNGVVIAECDGSTNSQEVKYKERTVWRENSRGVKESVKEETPIFDVLNTLQKMAQKRAMIGATILATGASEYFTQDILEPEDIAKAKDSGKPKESERKDVGSGDQQTSSESAPMCCGAEMMISKYDDKEFGHKPWYCVKCRSKKPRE